MIDAFTTPPVYVRKPMHDKPQTAPAGEFRLPHHQLLSLAGRDAMAFAQAQFMSDVAALADGQWQWSGWLTPKGRTIALFALLRLDAETLWLLLPDADAAALADALRRYVFRSKVVVAPLDATVAGGFAAPAQASGNRFAALGEGWIELDMSGEHHARTLHIGPLVAPDDAGALARWDAADLAHGLPRLPASQANQWTPQQLSLERLRAFSVKKGCYPGQEIVARTHFLGQAKRGLALFESDATPPVGAEVLVDGRAAGSIVAAADLLALAVLPVERSGPAQLADGAPLRERPLDGGLAR
jgi:folate-binding protein YgfZ